MTTKSETGAPVPKLYTYYGNKYTQPVEVIAKLANVSVRYMKYVLQLQGMGYQGRIDEGWTMAQCFADAGMERKRRATPKVSDLDGAVCKIKRLRGMLFDLGVDPDG